MFKDQVYLISPFTEGTINKRIQGSCDWISQDRSLFMTSYILFNHRMENFKFQNNAYFINNPESLFEANFDKDPSVITYVWIGWTKSEEPEFCPEDYTPLPNHETFLSNKLNSKVYIRSYPQYNTVCFFTSRITHELMHLAQSFIPVYFPTLFENNPRTEDETNLLCSLTMKTPAAYEKAVCNFLDREDIRRNLISDQICGFEKRFRERKIRTQKNILQNIENTLQNMLESYKQKCEERNAASTILDGLIAQSSRTETDTEFEEYLCENRNITNISISNSKISFIVKTFLTPYLPDSWDCLKRNGSIFDGYYMTNCFSDENNIELFLDAIFSRNHTLKLRMCAYFNMDIEGTGCTSIRDYDYVSENPHLRNYMPNPHLNMHNCFGMNMNDILEQLRAGDMIGAVECCINVTKRVNTDEVNATFRPFVEKLLAFKGKCIVTPEGDELSPVEALEYLKKKEEEA